MQPAKRTGQQAGSKGSEGYGKIFGTANFKQAANSSTLTGAQTQRT
jgi:hypothetical protein